MALKDLDELLTILMILQGVTELLRRLTRPARWTWLLAFIGTPFVLAHLAHAQSRLYAPVFSDVSPYLFKTLEHTLVPCLLIALAWVHAKSKMVPVLPIGRAYAIIPIIINLSPIFVYHGLFRYSTELGPRLGPQLGSAICQWPVMYLATYANARQASLLPKNDDSSIDYGEALREGPLSAPLVQIVLYAVYGTYRLWRPFWRLIFGRPLVVGVSSLTLIQQINASREGELNVSINMIMIYTALSVVMLCFCKERDLKWIRTLPILFISLLVTYGFYVSGGVPQYRHGITEVYSNQFPPDYKILARMESVTGLVSVAELQMQDRWIRYMRVDHSLLGGIWYEGTGSDVADAESIYTTFHLQEAVRLVDSELSSRPTALIIGLGIGSVVQGLEKHGVQTTVVELDPVVYSYAREYFGLPNPSGGAHLIDARQFLDTAHQTYDYIVHDVFTGGSMPAKLLTNETWTAVKTKLNHGGIVAINFAGQPDSKNGKIVLNTILHSFELCKAFTDKTSESTTHLNMVIFCSDADFHFRTPTAADYLGSYQREKALRAFEHRQVNLSPYRTNGSQLTDSNAAWVDSQAEIREHWHVMRKVLPAYVWESY